MTTSVLSSDVNDSHFCSRTTIDCRKKCSSWKEGYVDDDRCTGYVDTVNRDQDKGIEDSYNEDVKSSGVSLTKKKRECINNNNKKKTLPQNGTPGPTSCRRVRVE